MTEPTELPWEIRINLRGHVFIKAPSDEIICELIGPDREAHAAFIVKSANLHHEIVNILECVAGDYEERGITGYILEFMKAAIIKAKEV